MKIITKNQIIRLHDQIISEAGGTRGLRDEGLLESALFTTFQVFGNEELYPSMKYSTITLRDYAAIFADF